MVGLDAAGKTTILYKLKLGEIVTTIPTIGTDWLHCVLFLKIFWYILSFTEVQRDFLGEFSLKRLQYNISFKLISTKNERVILC